MTAPALPTLPDTAAAAADETPEAVVLVEQDVLVEDVSIDGMCGVY